MFDVRAHQVSAPFAGNARAAFDVARTALLSLGFEIVEDSDAELRARGPGMRSNREPALLGVSDLTLRVDAGAITASAQLGGVAGMRAFVYLFPPGLVAFLLLSFRLSGMDVGWQTLWVLAPWPILAPWMASAMERRTTQAVDRLVRGMASR